MFLIPHVWRQNLNLAYGLVIEANLIRYIFAILIATNNPPLSSYPCFL